MIASSETFSSSFKWGFFSHSLWRVIRKLVRADERFFWCLLRRNFAKRSTFFTLFFKSLNRKSGKKVIRERWIDSIAMFWIFFHWLLSILLLLCDKPETHCCFNVCRWWKKEKSNYCFACKKNSTKTRKRRRDSNTWFNHKCALKKWNVLPLHSNKLFCR